MTSCRICDSDQVSQSFRFRGYGVLCCRACGVEFLDPQPDPATLAKIYSADYFLNEREGVAGADVDRLKRQTAKLYIDLLVRAGCKPEGRLLEIGCGSGDLLLEAQARGFEVSGIETSEYGSARANCRLGRKVVQRGEIETVNLTPGTADVVVFCDVIEHVRDPRMFLDFVHECLRPGGLVFVVTPSTDSWSRRLMGTRWMEYKTEHLFYFSQRSLTHLLKQDGFEAIQFHATVKSLSFDYVRAHFRRFQVPFWSGAVELAGRAIPSGLARREFQIAASGVTAIARKRE